MIDRYPTRGGHSVIKKTSKSPGGAGCNVAHNIASLGIKASIYTTLGRDEDAEYFIRNTAAEVVAKFTDRKTGRVHVFVDKDGERTFFVEPNAAGKPFVKVQGGEFLYLDPFPSEKSFGLQREAAEKFDGFVILNPGFPYVHLGYEALKPLLDSTHMLILSSDEFSMLNVEVVDLLKHVDYLIVTQGRLGSVCYTRKGESYRADAFKAKVVDATGAGDAFAAGFIYGFIMDYPVDVCLKLGNFCGAYNVERVGARNFPSPKTIKDFLATVLR
nr:PfkB family carbohydrate kinase [Archaeoglobus neptunius]